MSDVTTVHLGIGLLAFVGFIFLFASFLFFWHSKRIEGRALMVEATILSINVSTQTYNDEENRMIVRYAPSIEFQYRVNGTSYTSTSLNSFGSEFGSLRWAKEICDRYQAGQRVQAFYDPTSPSNSFLIKGSRSNVMHVVGIIGLVTLILSVLAFMNRPK